MTMIPNPNAGNPGKSVTSVTPLRRPCADLRREVWVQQGWHADQHHIPGQKKREHAATQKKEDSLIFSEFTRNVVSTCFNPSSINFI